MNRTEQQKMLAGELYRSTDATLQAELARTQGLLRQLNQIPNEDTSARTECLRVLFSSFGDGTQIRSPFFCDYGTNIRIGSRGFVNFNCVFLDCNLITIGDDAQIGPGVQIYTAFHPLDAETRRSGLEAAKPVMIGNNVWLGGGAIVLPGVTIGDDCVIGAGSVVTRNVPPGVLAAGNPCRVLRDVRT